MLAKISAEQHDFPEPCLAAPGWTPKRSGYAPIHRRYRSCLPP
jgi:hypothetical protein